MKDITKKYTNGEVTIVWKPSLCSHSTNCWKGQQGLRNVFDPSKKPWINPEGASTESIIAQVKKCPSGALSYSMNEGIEKAETTSNNLPVVEVTENGPLLVHGTCVVKEYSGNEFTRENVTAFCRCGMSSNKPYCDGSHRKGFVG